MSEIISDAPQSFESRHSNAPAQLERNVTEISRIVGTYQPEDLLARGGQLNDYLHIEHLEEDSVKGVRIETRQSMGALIPDEILCSRITLLGDGTRTVEQYYSIDGLSSAPVWREATGVDPVQDAYNKNLVAQRVLSRLKEEFEPQSPQKQSRLRKLAKALIRS